MPGKSRSQPDSMGSTWSSWTPSRATLWCIWLGWTSENQHRWFWKGARGSGSWRRRWCWSRAPWEFSAPSGGFLPSSRPCLLCRRNREPLAHRSPRTCWQLAWLWLLLITVLFFALEPFQDTCRWGSRSRRESLEAAWTWGAPRSASRSELLAFSRWCLLASKCIRPWECRNSRF